MSDERLRELERRWKESGSDEDEAAWLVERVRQGERLDWESYSRLAVLNMQAASEYLLARVKRGDLERVKLELAAYCGHEPARAGLGLGPPLAASTGLEDWIVGLHSWGIEALARAGLGALEAGRPLYEDENPNDTTIAMTLNCVENWLRHRLPEHTSKAKKAQVLATQAWRELGSRSRFVARAASIVADFPTLVDRDESLTGPARLVAKYVGVPVNQAEIKMAVEERLVRWALLHYLMRT